MLLQLRFDVFLSRWWEWIYEEHTTALSKFVGIVIYFGGFCGIFFLCWCAYLHRHYRRICILYIVIISDDCQWWGWMSLDYYYSSTRINTKLSCCKNKMDAINSSNRVKDRKESVFLCVRFDSFIASIRFTIIISHSHRDDTMSSFIYYGKYGECEYSYKMRSD